MMACIVVMQVADVPRSAPLKTRLMWPALGLTAAMVATQVRQGFDKAREVTCYVSSYLNPCCGCICLGHDA